MMEKFRSFITFLKKIKNPFDKRDAHIYGGLFIMSIGLWQVVPWLSLTAIGFLLFCAGIFARKLA